MANPAASEIPSALPLQTRLSPVSSIDAASRTVDVVFTTGAAVRRARYTGWDTRVPFDEILVVTDAAVDLTRLRAGAPALDSHSFYTTFAQVGVVDAARIAGGEGLATIRFPSKGVDEASDRMFALVNERIIRNISVGYSILELRVEEPTKAGEVEKRIATRWQPFEISFVTVPADAGAQTRASDMTFPLVVQRSAPPAPLAPYDLALGAAARMRMRMLAATR